MMPNKKRVSVRQAGKQASRQAGAPNVWSATANGALERDSVTTKPAKTVKVLRP